MSKPRGKVSDERQQGDDLEAFEEFESGGVPDEVPEGEAPAVGKGAVSPDEELDLGAFGEPREEPRFAAPAPAQEEAPAAKQLADELAELSPDVPVNLVAVIGKTTTNVGRLIKYRIGQVVDLGRPPAETVDLVANGRLIARGELVDMDGKLGVRIVKLVR